MQGTALFDVCFCFVLQKTHAMVAADNGSIGLSAELRLYTGQSSSL